MKYLLVSLIFPLVLNSCGVLQPVKDTTVHHLLEPAVSDRLVTGSSPVIAIARPALPSYLDREQLVSRSGNGQLQMNNYHLWAEPLDAAISRVTATNLALLKNSLNIQPVETFITLDYQSILEIRISRFETDDAGSVVLECTWKLQPVSGRIANTRPFRTIIPVSTEPSTTTAATLTGRVAAMNECLARLAREIARSL